MQKPEQVYIPIKGKEDLVRDYTSMGVANADSRKALNARNHIREEKERLRIQRAKAEKQEQDINTLQQGMQEMRMMLQRILDKLEK